MKTIFVFLCTAIVLAGCSTPLPAPTAAPQTRPALTDPSQPIEVEAGETFHIFLDTNPSTGYHWEIIGDLNGVEFISTEYTADEPAAPGTGGVDVWTFKAVSSGETQITLGYFPPATDAAEPHQTVTFDIVVK